MSRFWDNTFMIADWGGVGKYATFSQKITMAK